MTEEDRVMRRVILDRASTEPLRPVARAAMIDALDRVHADPGRTYTEALEVRHLLEGCREQIADLLGARPREVVFCSGATEAINAVTRFGRLDGQVASRVEHAAVRSGVLRGPHRLAGCGPDGRVDPDELIELAHAMTGALSGTERGRAVVVHLQWANQEVGALQPVTDLVDQAAGDDRIWIHSDAAMAAGRLPLDFSASGVTLMSISSHKLGGPVGVGALLIARGKRIGRLLDGGDQERARRAGMENVVGIAGFAAALADADQLREQSMTHRGSLVDRLRQWIALTPDIDIVGPEDPARRLRDLVCTTVAGIEPQALVLELDRAGFAVHSGSSCASEVLEPSPVLAAMGRDAERSLRISIGDDTTDDDISRFIAAAGAAIASLRALARGSSPRPDMR